MRKSKQQRIAEGNALIEAIKQDPVLVKEQQWLLRFLGDLVSKFKRGKGGTSRQRTLFDEKIADGVPARKINTHVAQPEVLKAEAAIQLLKSQPELYSWEIRVGGEIVANGLRFNLSPKQLALLDTFIKKAEQVEAQTSMPVDPAKVTEAQLYCDLADTYIGLTAKKCKDIDILRSAIAQNIGFSDEQLEAGQRAVSGELKRYKKLVKKFTAGMLVQWRKIDMVLVVGMPEIADFGNNARGYYGGASKAIRIPLIVNGEIINAKAGYIHKYTKKELKELGAI